MEKVRLFSDETGNFDFSRRPGASRFFGVGTLEVTDQVMKGLQSDLADLRMNLLSKGLHLNHTFHASTDKQRVRDQVFEVLAQHDFKFDATMLEKAKAQPQLRKTDARFYQYAWFYHLKNRAPSLRTKSVTVITADLGTKNQRRKFKSAVENVVTQCMPTSTIPVAFWPSTSELCLQAADYCLWAISRQFERSDGRALAQIEKNLRSQYDLFSSGKTLYY
jgi:hypothetical protein